MQFAHTVTTNAPAETIWRIWTDVTNWPEWDVALEWARLDGPFALNTGGRLKSKGSPESPFTITQLDAGRSYTFSTHLPLAQLHIRRELTPGAHTTDFTHTVAFTGPLGWLFGRILGTQFRTTLPEAMERIRAHAEQAEVR